MPVGKGFASQKVDIEHAKAFLRSSFAKASEGKYFKVISINFLSFFPFFSTFSINPFFSKILAISYFKLEKGIKGFVPVSEIDWNRIKHPNEKLKNDKEYDFKII
ncbi:MAG: hypothetical protein CVT83_08105, partial [Alphaproteobacteria bacterium HGW-Alphaproteobacteria-5]